MERRISKRIALEVPVQAGAETGTLRDISGSGVYFITSGTYHLGDRVCFSFELKHIVPAEPIKLNFLGHVVRMEQFGERTGIAATIDRYNF